MNLNKRTLLYLAGIVSGLAVLFIVFFYLIVIASIKDIERSQVEKIMARAKEALRNELVTLEKTALSWSEWDDTYYFAGGSNPGFVDKYINKESLSSLDAEVVGVINNNEQFMLLRKYDGTNETYVPTTEDETRSIAETYKSLKAGGINKGFMPYNGKPLMITFNNITTSDTSGPTNGIFVLGKIINDEALAGLSSVVQAEMKMELIEVVANGKAEYTNAIKYLDDNRNEILINNEGLQIAGYSYFKDITQKPIILAKVVVPRDIYININKNYLFFLATAIIGMVGCAILMYRYIKLEILSRITAISEFLEVHTSDENSSTRIRVEGNDEIAGLENNINKIIDSFEKRKRSK
jgi:hypothetical protein